MTQGALAHFARGVSARVAQISFKIFTQLNLVFSEVPNFNLK
jgi:hypothetical protein